MEPWHYQHTIKECKPFIFENYGYPGQTVNLAMRMFEAELIKHETWQFITELSHENERLNYLLNHFLDPSYTDIKNAFDFIVEQFNAEQYPNISEHLSITLGKVKTYEKPPEEPILEHLDRLHDNVSDLTPNQLKESLKNIRVQIVAEGFDKDATANEELKQEAIMGATHTTSEERHSAINIRDSEGTTALMQAVERGDIDDMSELFDCPNLDLTVYDYGGLTFEFHVFGKSILKYMYIDTLKYYVPMLNFYDTLKNEKSNLEWDKIMKVTEFLLARENVNKTHLLKACIMFGDNRVIDMVLKSVLKTVVITEDIKGFILDIVETINPVVVKFLPHVEISLNACNEEMIIWSVIRYNCPDTSAALIDQLGLAHNKALKTVLCLQSVPPGVLLHILKRSTFNLNDRDDRDNATVFMTLCRFGSYETVSKLMEQTDIEIDYNAHDSYGNSCFMRALQRHTEDVSLLLLRNPKLAVIIKSIIKSDDRVRRYTLLIEASKRGHVNSVVLLINYGAMVNTKGRGDMTALIMASRGGKESTVEKFLSISTIDINAKNDYIGETALHAASISGHDKIVKLLSEHEGVEINAVDRYGRSALHYACKLGHDAVVTQLIKHGIPLDSKDEDGETPLHKACWKGHNVVVSKLIKHSCVDINAKSHYNFTPLYLASARGNVASVAVLVAHSDIDVNIGDINSNTALHIASLEGHTSVVSQLISHTEIYVNAKNRHGYTELHTASSHGRADVVSYLITHSDVQIDAKNEEGETAGQVALSTGYNDIASRLMNINL